MSSGDGTADLLTRAADAAGRAVAELVKWPDVPEMIRDEGWRDEMEPIMIAASNPDHWRAVEATLRAVAARTREAYDAGRFGAADDYASDGLALAEQVLRDLGSAS